MKTLKEKALSGALWNFVESSASQIIGFVSTIILARILSPHDFGLVGMTVIITALAQVLLDSGFSQALIRKHDCKPEDYDTVFLFNFIIGILLYFLIYFLAPLFASFYKVEELKHIIRVISITIPLNSLTLINKTMLIKNLELKKHSIITLVAVSVAFVFAVFFAKTGHGVWSLVYRSIIQQLVVLMLFVFFVRNWKPRLLFSKSSFTTLFSFGSRLVVISSISIVFKNSLNMIIGKFYGSNSLGLYTNADQMSGLPAGVLTTVYNKVAYPVLVEVNGRGENLKDVIRGINHPLIVLSFVLLSFLAAVSGSLIPMLLGVEWKESAVYFQILCFGYMAAILQTVNQVVLNVKGRSDLFLRTELMKYALFVPVIVVGLIFNVKVFLIAFSIHYWIGFMLNAKYAKSLIKYDIAEQLKDLAKPLMFAMLVFIVTLVPGLLLERLSFFFVFIVQVFVAGLVIFALLNFKVFKVYKELLLKLVADIKRRMING